MRIQKIIFMLCFIFLLQVVAARAITISNVGESPSQVEYEEAITITATISSAVEIRTAQLTVDGLTYTMIPTKVANEYQITLHTIDNLAALGFAVYPYSITAEDVRGNAVTYTDSIEVIMSDINGVSQSSSRIQEVLAWVWLWIY